MAKCIRIYLTRLSENEDRVPVSNKREDVRRARIESEQVG